ncbi:hypothetical protein [Candidatus Villigracilis proximus]
MPEPTIPIAATMKPSGAGFASANSKSAPCVLELRRLLRQLR